MRLSALGSVGEGLRADHEDDRAGTDVPRKYALSYREAEGQPPDIWLAESGKASPPACPRTKEVSRLSAVLTSIPPKARHFIEDRDVHMPQAERR